jgi:hypothetical protein
MPGVTFNGSDLNLFRRVSRHRAVDNNGGKDEHARHFSLGAMDDYSTEAERKLKKLLAAGPSNYAEVATNALETSHNLWARYPLRRMVMLRKTVLALLAAVTIGAVGLATATDASARGGFGGGGFHGGGFHGGGFGGGGFRGGFAGGGFRGGGFHRGGFRGAALGVGLGLGLAGAYAAYGYPYGYGYGYDPYYAGYYDDGYGYAGYGYGGGCYIVRQRVWGPYGPAFRRVQVCN